MSTRNYRLSQNFLRSPRLALRLIGHSNIRKKDLVVEIGAGSGVITTALARRAGKVVAIEADAGTAAKLRENLRRQDIRNVEVIEKDFREVEIAEILERNDVEEYKVFANPPFHLSAEVFYWLLGLENVEGEIRRRAERPVLPKAIYLILQKQMALKLIPTDRHYTSQLGKMIIGEYDARIRLPLWPTDFTPPPKVPTVLYEAKRRFEEVVA